MLPPHPPSDAERTTLGPEDARPVVATGDARAERACDEMVDRWGRGERVPSEDFLGRWEGPVGLDEIMEVIYTEYLIREEAREDPLGDLAGRFPEQADRLRRQVAMHRSLEFGTDGGDPAGFGDGPVVPGAASEERWPTPLGYVIRRILGRGGMGVVYEALQVRLNRVVALKMIRAGVHASAEDRSRFVAEAEAIARLRHPNIVQIHALGDCEGQPYFEMEYVDGGSLADRLDGTPRPPRDASTLVETTARAIHEAHRRGVVHRDLKPSNILLMADGSPKIVDFGLAKLIGSDSGLTRTDSVLGSPAYMAPEQATGQAARVGPAADVYALGAIFYEMLTGRQPFVAGTALETLEQVRGAEPIPPSRFRPSLPRDLETICLRCLAKDPARRFATAEALADDLGRWARGEPILTRPTGLMERAYRWSGRNRAVAALVASIAVMSIGGTTGMAVLWRRARAEAARSASANVELARISAGVILDRGQALAEAGDVGRGLPFMARAVQIDADGRAGIGEAARANLAAWSPLVPPTTRAGRSPPGEILSSADRRVVAIVGEDGVITVWDPIAFRASRRIEARPDGGYREIAISPDGRLVATVSSEGNSQVWETSTGRSLGRLSAQPGHPQAALSPDGSVLATSSESTLRLWDVNRGRVIGDPIASSLQIRDLAFSPDGATLVVVNRDGEIERCDGRTGRRLGPTIRLGSPGWCVAFRPDGSRFAVGRGFPDRRDESAGVYLFETATGRPIGERMPHRLGVSFVAYRPDGRVLISGDYEGQTRLWDDGGRPIGEPSRGEERIVGATFSPDGAIALQRSLAGTIRLLDAMTGRQLGATIEYPGMGWADFDPEGRRLIVAHEDFVREVDLGAVISPGPAFARKSMALCFLDEGRALLVGGEDGVARIASTGDARQLGWPMPHRAAVTVAVQSPDGTRIATGSRDATVRIWDSQGRPTVPPIPISHWARALRFSPDGRRLLASDESGAARLIDPIAGRVVGKPLKHPMKFDGATVASVFFSKDGRVGFSVGTSGSVGRVDGTTGAPIGEFWNVPHPAKLEAVSPDGRTLMLNANGSIRAIDLATGRQSSPAFGVNVRSLAITPDGRGVVVGYGDKMVRFWDAATVRQVGPPITLSGPAATLSIDGDGRTLVTASQDGQVRAWDLASRKPIGPVHHQDLGSAKIELSPDGRSLAMTEGVTRLFPISGSDATRSDLLPARIADLTGTILDAQGGIARVPGPVPTFDASKLAGPGDWHSRMGAESGLRDNHPAALWHLDRAVAASPEDWYVHALRSETLSRLGRPDEAEAEGDRARSLAGPRLAATWEAHRGFNASAEGRWADAVAAFDRVLNAGESTELALIRDARGWAKAGLQDWAGASADLAGGAWRRYSMTFDIQRVGVIAMAAGDHQLLREVVKHLLKPWVDGTRKDPERAAHLARFVSSVPGMVDDPGLIVRLAEPAARISGSPDDLDHRIGLGMALYRWGRFEESIARLSEVYQGSRIDEDNTARCFLAMAARRVGRIREARHWLELAERDPMPSDVYSHLIQAILVREAKIVVLDSGFPAEPFLPPRS